jgi:DNA-binding NarL/FixJ family response regulator
MERVRLLLISDYTLVRESLSRQLALESGLEVVAEFGAPHEGLAALRGAAVDMVLLDCEAEAGEFIAAAREAGYRGSIVVITSGLDAANLLRALRAGASGVFLKEKSLDSLVRAIRLVASGEAWVDPAVMRLMAESLAERANPAFVKALTSREQQLLAGVLDGLTNRKIAARLGISEACVKAALRLVFKKASVRTRSQLVRAALGGRGGDC